MVDNHRIASLWGIDTWVPIPRQATHAGTMSVWH